jgi:hypothetical protein
MTFLPRTRCASLAASARSRNRPHRIARVTGPAVELAFRLLNIPADERRAQIADMHDATLTDVMTVLDLHTGSAYELWNDTPSGFAEDVLGLTLTDSDRAVLDPAAGADVRCVAARVPHPRNHELAAVLIAWAALVSCPRPYGDVPRVAVSLAPYRNTLDSVWRVLARFIDQAVLPGRLDLVRRGWWADDLGGRQPLMAFAVWNTDPYSMSGLHQFFAVVADADRVADPDLRATMGYLADSVYGGSRMVALGGTTDEPEEWFGLYEGCDDVTVAVDLTK